MSSFAPLAYQPLGAGGSYVAPLDVGSSGRPPVLVDLRIAEPPRAEPAETSEPTAADGAGPALVADIADQAPLLSQAELDQAVAAAVAETEERVRAEVTAALQSSQERRLAETLERCAAELRDLRASTLAGRADQEDVRLALAIARRIVPHAIDRAPLADIEAMLVDLLRGLEPEPRLELKLAPDLLEPGRTVAAEVAERAGFAGDLVVEAEPGLEPGDARLIWRDGRATRRINLIVAEVEEALAEVWAGAPVAPEAADADDPEPTGGMS